jgi:hypothetical protein
MMKVYTLDQNDLQRTGQAATTAFLNTALADKVITQEQYDELSKYSMICHTPNGFIERLKNAIGFNKEENGYEKIYWTANQLIR